MATIHITDDEMVNLLTGKRELRHFTVHRVDSEHVDLRDRQSGETVASFEYEEA